MKKYLLAFALLTMLSWSASAEEIGGAHASMNFSCTDCHQTDTPDGPPAMKSCLECHASYAALATATAPTDVDPADKESSANPHDSHMGQIDCYSCHKTHSQSELICAECHSFEFEPK